MILLGMPIALSQEEKNQVLLLHYQGFTNSEIHQKTGTSTGSISSIITKHTKNAKDGNPSDTVAIVRKFKKAGLSLDEVSHALHVHFMIERLGLSDDSFEKLVSVYFDSQNQNINAEDLIHCSAKVLKIQSKAEIPLENLPDQLDSMYTKKKQLEQKIKECDQEYQKISKDTKSALESKNTTIEELQKYCKLNESLKNSKLHFQDYAELINVISSAKEFHYDIFKIKEYLLKENSHQQRISDYEEKIQKYDESIKDKKVLKQSLLDEISSYQNKLDEEKNLYAEERSSINFLKRLKKSNISPLQIKYWDDVLNKSSLTDSEFAQNLKDIDHILELKVKLNDKISELNYKISQKQGKKDAIQKAIASLESQHDSLKEKITDITDHTIYKVVKEAKQGISKISDSVGYHNIAITHRMDKITNDIEKRLISKINELEDSMKQNNLAKQNEAKFAFLEPLYSVYIEGKGDKPHVYIALIHLLTSLEKWLQTTEHNMLVKSKAKRLREELQELLAKQAMAN